MTSLACCAAHAQRNALAVLDPEAAAKLPASTLLAADPIADTPTANTPILDLPVAVAASENPGTLPDAPTPHNVDGSEPPNGQQQEQRPLTPGFPPVSTTPRQLPRSPEQHPGIPSQPSSCSTNMSTSVPGHISCAPSVDYFRRFVDSGVHPLTPRQKAYLAFRNTTDPYNFATIGLVSAVSTAADPGSPYGPGVPGFGRNFGVAYCETAVGEFFGTFLIPAIAHQDPHYHRMPNASYSRRIGHAISQVVVAQSDYGLPMPNYSNLITTAVGDGLGNLYVPGRQKDWGSAVARYSTAIATDPIDNLITEFLPDVARHVNVHIVLIQQIVNQVEKQN